jgi:hypothetical protein
MLNVINLRINMLSVKAQCAIKLYPGYFLIWQQRNLFGATTPNIINLPPLSTSGLTDQDSTLSFILLNYFWRQLL